MKAPKLAAETAASRSASPRTTNGAAAELQHDALEMSARAFGDQATNFRRAGETDAARLGVGDQFIHDFGRVGRGIANHVQHAPGKAGLLEDRPDRKMRPGRFLRGLQNDGVAVRNRGCDGTHAENHRCVPGGDAGDNSHGLTDSHRGCVRQVGGNDFPDHGVGLRGCFAQDTHRIDAIEHTPTESLARFQSRDFRDLRHAPLERLGGF